MKEKDEEKKEENNLNDFVEENDLLDFTDEDFEITKEKPSYLEKKISKNSILLSFSFLVICLIFSTLHWQDPSKYQFYLMKQDLLSSNSYYRIITSIFAHADIAHLLSNSFLLFIFGLLLHNYYGFTIFPFVSLILGCLANIITIQLYDHPQIRLLGASSMVYSMIAMWLIWYVRYEKKKEFKTKLMRIFGFILIILLPTKFSANTSYLGHFVGFILGIIASFSFLFITDQKVKENDFI